MGASGSDFWQMLVLAAGGSLARRGDRRRRAAPASVGVRSDPGGRDLGGRAGVDGRGCGRWPRARCSSRLARPRRTARGRLGECGGGRRRGRPARQPSSTLGARNVRELARRLGSAPPRPTGVMRSPPARPEFEALAEEVADLPRRLDELRRRADALEQSRRDLVTWVSHDLRSPLATIRAMAEALDDGVVSDDATLDRYHHQIRRDAERLSALVDDLFELSRIHSGALEVAAGPGVAAATSSPTCSQRLAAPGRARGGAPRRRGGRRPGGRGGRGRARPGCCTT